MGYFILITFLLIAIIGFYLDYFYKQKKNVSANVKSKSNYFYHQKPFMTNQEKYFYDIFKTLEEDMNIIVHPQTNLASIIQKDYSKYRTDLFRNVDFAIFTKDYGKLLFLVEINDKSHNQYKRRKRDNKVKEICRSANIELITFYTSYSNTKEYVINRIKETYNKIQNNNIKTNS